MKYFLIILIFSLGINAHCQQYLFKNFSINEGLPQSTVYSLLQDSRGFMWMGTEGGGLYKFDGQSGKIYNRSNGLSGNIIRSLFEDSKGNIWIGTDNGLTLYDGFKFTNLSKNESLPGTTILNIMETHSGIICVATDDAGLNCITEYNDSLVYTNFSVKSGLLSNFVFDVIEDQYNRLWLAMAGGISIIDFNEPEPRIIKLAGGYDLPDNFILSVEQDQAGSIWFGSYNSGAFYFDSIKELNILSYKIPKNDLLVSGTIWDIYKDHQNSLWFATDKKGMLQLTDKNDLTQYNESNGLLTNQVLSLTEDYEYNIWMGTMANGAILFPGKEFISYDKNNGLLSNNISSFLKLNEEDFLLGTSEGLSIIKLQNNKIETIKTISSTANVKALEKGRDGAIYVAVKDAIYLLQNGKLIPNYSFDTENLVINDLLFDSNNNLWAATNNGYYKFSDKNEYNFNQSDGLINNEAQYIIEDKAHNVWLATLGGIVKINEGQYTDYNEQEGLSNTRIHTLCEDINGDIWIGCFGGGLFKFYMNKDSLPIQLIADNTLLTSNNIYSIKLINDSTLIVGTDKGFDKLLLDKERNIITDVKYYQNEGYLIGENNLNAILKFSEDEIIFGTGNGFTKYTIESAKKTTKLPNLITDIKLFYKNVDWNSKNIAIKRYSELPAEFILKYNENHLTFENTAINFTDPKQTEYSFKLLGQSSEWSPFSSDKQRLFSSLKPGSYIYQVRAKDKYGNISANAEISFTITPPFYQTLWFYTSVILFFIISIWIFIRYREQKLKEDKVKLEKIVAERTQEVLKQKEEITDSINYASRIQRAILPSNDKSIYNNLNSFVLFKPRDIVSGDFYWLDHIGDFSIYIAADCTGHGVPGAFMSMLGISFLNEIILTQNILTPNLILNKLREKVKFALKQHGKDGEAKDGMDIAICVINRNTLELQYAGAYNPAYIYRKNGAEFELIEFKADRMPIGIYIKERECFENHTIQLQKNDTFYIFSDGYIDQFGGEKGGKFKTNQFKIFLQNLQTNPIAEHKNLLDENIESWMGSYDQIDDIIVIGVRVMD